MIDGHYYSPVFLGYNELRDTKRALGFGDRMVKPSDFFRRSSREAIKSMMFGFNACILLILLMTPYATSLLQRVMVI